MINCVQSDNTFSALYFARHVSFSPRTQQLLDMLIPVVHCHNTNLQYAKQRWVKLKR